jgi:hypothetical protein
MTDTNGHVDPSHLVNYQGVNISKAIYPNVSAAGTQFRQEGYTFGIQLPGGGDRPWDMQGAMRADYDRGVYLKAPYYLSPPPSPRPGAPGTSRHGFALAVDVVSNAPKSRRDQIMAAHSFHVWSSSDPNHYEPDWLNVLSAPPESAFADVDTDPLEEEDMDAEQDQRLKNIETAVLRYIATPAGTTLQPRTDDLAVWIGTNQQMIAGVSEKVGVPVDPAALAKDLAPLILPGLAAAITSGQVTLAQLQAELSKLPAETVKAFAAQLGQVAQG